MTNLYDLRLYSLLSTCRPLRGRMYTTRDRFRRRVPVCLQPPHPVLCPDRVAFFRLLLCIPRPEKEREIEKGNLSWVLGSRRRVQLSTRPQIINLVLYYLIQWRILHLILLHFLLVKGIETETGNGNGLGVYLDQRHDPGRRFMQIIVTGVVEVEVVTAARR